MQGPPVDIQTTIRIDHIAARLSAIIRNRTELDVAVFRFVGLDCLAKNPGPVSAQPRRTFWDVAESFIQSQLQPNDILVRNDAGFLVVFAKRIGDAAVHAAQDIAFELNARLARSRGPSPRISASTRPVPVHDLARTVHGRAKGEVFGPTDSEPPALTAVEWQFQPVWEAGREEISRYFLVPVAKDSEDRIRGYQFEDLGDRRPDFAAMDEASLLVSEQALKLLRSEGRTAVVGVTLHIDSFRHEKSASRLMKVLAGLDVSLARDRMITLTGAGPRFPKLQLGHIVAALRIRVPEVALSAAWDVSDLDALIAAGPTAITFAYPDRVAMALTQLAGATLMARFTVGAAAAHAHGLPLYVDGAIDRLQAFAFREAGADFLASPLIWRRQAAPQGVLQWPVNRLSAA
jgi:hypothetical protein